MSELWKSLDLQPIGQSRDEVAALRERLQKAQQEHRMGAKVDAAQTSQENRNHWGNADSFSADAAFNPQVRFNLRNRARYEVTNNCYAKGDVRAGADDLIGTGPRLQLTLPAGSDESGEAARAIERNLGRWMDATHLPINLRIAEKSHERDGECYAVFDNNERLANPVKFDLRWMESEMCTSPFQSPATPNIVDGVKFDRFGNPVEYYFLKYHPGSVNAVALLPLEFYTVPAENVIHWYSPDRFGQHRGIPEITPALPLYAQLRRYTLATLTAAEFAAMIAGVMKSNVSLEDPGTDTLRFDPIEMVRGALMTLPFGYDATQFDAKQPTTTYPEFKREILNESGRATGKPLNVVSGNSSGYNFSSGRLDHLPYQRGIRITRNDLRLLVLDRIFRDGWYPEALLVGQIPEGLPPIEEWTWSWNWDGFDSIDQNKDANADDSRIKNGTSTYAEILAEYGQDWQQVFEQLAREKAYAEKLGLPWPILSMPIQETESVSNATSKPLGPDNLEQSVQFALDQAGVGEDDARDIIDALGPTISEVKLRMLKRSRNGRNGVHQ